MASAIYVFLETLDEFTNTFSVGFPDVTTLPLLLFITSMGSNYQNSPITPLILLVPSVGFMLFIKRFMRADVLTKVGTLTSLPRPEAVRMCAVRKMPEGWPRTLPILKGCKPILWMPN